MAGDWIKMRRSLLTDPKVVRISSALNADRFRTIGALFSAWCLFDEQTSDGILVGYSAEVFEEIVGVPGLATAMESVGWLEINTDFLAAVGFTEHNGQSAKRRAQENVRKMSARNADTKADEKRTREEKRREEKNTNKQTHPFLEDKEFVTLFESFQSASSKSHNWFPGQEIYDSWLYDLTRFPIDEAKKILRLSTSAGAKKPILNGDHKPRSPTTRQRVDLTLGPDD